MFVGVPADPNANGNSLPVDTAIEHRVLGGAMTTVVTAAQVAHDLRIAGHPRAVAELRHGPVRQTARRPGRHREPRVQDRRLHANRQAGRQHAGIRHGAIGWSPAGTRLIFSTADGVVTWTPGRTATRIPFSVASLQNCAWSPDEKQAAYWGFQATTDNAGPRPTEWVLVDVTHERAQAWPGRGYPLLWKG